MSVVDCRYGRFKIIESDHTISKSMQIYGEWAEDEIKILVEFIESGFTILDIGSFIGTHARAFSRAVGPSGKVFAFEPRKSIFEVLKENCEYSEFDNIEPLNFAVGANKISIPIDALDLNENKNFGALSLKVSNEAHGTENVNIISIDSLNLTKVDFMKIDVEGMENEVLEGAELTILNNRPVIFAECNNISDAVTVLKWGNKNKYLVFGFNTSAFNPNNFKNNNKNEFNDSKESGLLLIPMEKEIQFSKKIKQLNLAPMQSADDLALLLLHKPQFVGEVLAKLKSAEQLGILYPSELSRILEFELENDKALALAAAENERIRQQAHVDGLQSIILDYQNSTSWKITKPIRQLSSLVKSLKKFGQVYRSYRRVYPGITGFLKLVKLVNFVLWRNGFSGLLLRLRSLDTFGKVPGQKEPMQFHSSYQLKDARDEEPIQILDIAVHLHAFYPEQVNQFVKYLANIPLPFSLYITTDTEAKVVQIEPEIARLTQLKAKVITVTPNRGRDLGPMIVGLGKELCRHQLVLHIHTKKSPHNIFALSGWRRYLLESLLGNRSRVVAIINHFARNPKLGILFPNYFEPIRKFVYMKTNYDLAKFERLLSKKGLDPSIVIPNLDQTFFPAGDMFWFRGKAIEPIVKIGFDYSDFEPESGQVNQTLAHALERLFPFFAKEKKLTSEMYLAEGFLSQELTFHDFSLLNNYFSSGLLKNIVILFDHNGGGGTNVYTHNLIKEVVSSQESVLRVYFRDSNWLIQWYSLDDGMWFFNSSVEELFDFFVKAKPKKIIVNSLYGCPDIAEIISKIIFLKESTGAELDVKVHDFHSVCSSPHLLDYQSKYCEIPKDLSICKKCLSENRGWYHSWYPKEKRPTEINQWREPFKKLFQAASIINFFDQSGADLLEQVFPIDPKKILVTPHKIVPCKETTKIELQTPLHIGVLGTLSIVKGGEKIKELKKYFTDHLVNVPLTIVGDSFVEIPPGVNFHGHYEQKDLPKIVRYYGINVIFMASIVPETFSYTVSEAMAMGLPIVAFDLGAQGRRVRNYELGKVVPLNSTPEDIFNALQEVLLRAKKKEKNGRIHINY